LQNVRYVPGFNQAIQNMIEVGSEDWIVLNYGGLSGMEDWFAQRYV